MSRRRPQRRDPQAPSKAAAAGFLRTIAQKVNVPVADPVVRARDLQLIADCIEGRIRWRKGSGFTWEQERRIAMAVDLVERRPQGMAVVTAAQAHALTIAKDFGLRRDVRRIVNRILTLRRAARK